MHETSILLDGKHCIREEEIPECSDELEWAISADNQSDREERNGMIYIDITQQLARNL